MAFPQVFDLKGVRRSKLLFCFLLVFCRLVVFALKFFVL